MEIFNICSSESRLHLLEEHLRKHSWSNSTRHNICSICQSIMEGSFVKGTCHRPRCSWRSMCPKYLYV